jgi:hypothetical protein
MEDGREYSVIRNQESVDWRRWRLEERRCGGERGDYGLIFGILT